MKSVRCIVLLWSCAAVCAAAPALSLPDQAVVYLQAESGSRIELANLDLTPAGDGYDYVLRLNESLFSEHFLSMRPFKCFSTPLQMLCHLPYPYAKQHHLSAADLQDLEYDLLFIHRQPSDYGIDPWKGVYYRLEAAPEGIQGGLYEVDLNLLATPPDAGVTRPIGTADLHEAQPQAHAFPTLVIQ